MKNRFLLIIAALLFAINTNAQDHKQIIKQDMQLMINAVIKADYAALVNTMYPKLIEASGGRDSLVHVVTAQFKQLNSDGHEFVIKSITTGEPGNEVKINNIIYDVIPETVVVKVNGSTYKEMSSLIALSTDGGKHWWFNDAAGLEQLKTFLPDIAKLNIPPNSAPVKVE